MGRSPAVCGKNYLGLAGWRPGALQRVARGPAVCGRQAPARWAHTFCCSETVASMSSQVTASCVSISSGMQGHSRMKHRHGAKCPRGWRQGRPAEQGRGQLELGPAWGQSSSPPIPIPVRKVEVSFSFSFLTFLGGGTSTFASSAGYSLISSCF